MTIRSQDGAFTRYLLPTVFPSVLFDCFAVFVLKDHVVRKFCMLVLFIVFAAFRRHLALQATGFPYGHPLHRTISQRIYRFHGSPGGQPLEPFPWVALDQFSGSFLPGFAKVDII